MGYVTNGNGAELDETQLVIKICKFQSAPFTMRTFLDLTNKITLIFRIRHPKVRFRCISLMLAPELGGL